MSNAGQWETLADQIAMLEAAVDQTQAANAEGELTADTQRDTIVILQGGQRKRCPTMLQQEKGMYAEPEVGNE